MRAGVYALLLLVLLWCGLQIWMATAEEAVRSTPDYEKTELQNILEKETLSDGDYRTLFCQTGLGAPAVDKLRKTGTAADFMFLQKRFFEAPAYICDKNTPVSAEERLVDDTGKRMEGTRLVGLETGDILITPSCHTFGWRNGHAALVVDAEKGITLESVVLGRDSCLQRIDKWTCYPSLLVLRLKDTPPETRAAIAAAAKESLCDVPYGLTVGLFSEKYAEKAVSTHCAHLVWAAFQRFGYDLDSTGGRMVTPRDLANSPLLEVCQFYGLDPDRLWR